MTVPGAVDVIRDVVRNVRDVIIGAGTVLDVETTKRCMDAGAQFIDQTGNLFQQRRAGLRTGSLEGGHVLGELGLIANRRRQIFGVNHFCDEIRFYIHALDILFESDVVTGMKNKIQSAVANVMPNEVLGEAASQDGRTRHR